MTISSPPPFHQGFILLQVDHRPESSSVATAAAALFRKAHTCHAHGYGYSHGYGYAHASAGGGAHSSLHSVAKQDLRVFQGGPGPRAKGRGRG